MNEKNMTLIGHLNELRFRIIWVLLTFIMATIAGFFLAKPAIDLLKKDAAQEIEWYVISLTDGIRVYMQFAVMIGIILTLPVLFYHLWRFVAPGLKPNERRTTLVFIPLATLLFLIGILFGYYGVFPYIVRFLVLIANNLGAQGMYTMTQYFTFMFNFLLPMGLLFELPVIIMFLTRIGIITPKKLIKIRKYAYLLLIIIASMITPPDFISDIVVSIPLILLYEISIWFAKIVYRRKLKQESLLESSLDEK